MRIQKQVISAGEAESRLRDGERLEGFVIQGELKLSGTYSHIIEINECDIGEFRADDCELQDIQFVRSTFSRANFCNTKFNGKANFICSDFKVEGFFCGSTFKGNCEMVGASFTHAEFGGTTFESKADFSHSEFGELADFSRAKFKKQALFVEARFEMGADFRNSEFSGEAAFEKAIFGSPPKEDSEEKSQDGMGDGFFNVATFHEKADFDGAKFHCHADFRRVTFEGPVEFRGVEVSAGAHFNYAAFGGRCDFKKSEFGEFNCIQARVSEIFNFNLVTVGKSTDFCGTYFELDATFSHTRFGGEAKFEKVRFGQADFSSTYFNGSVDFLEAIFRRRVNFHQAGFADSICLLANFPNGAQLEWEQLKDGTGVGTRISNSRNGKHQEARDEFGRLKKIFESNNNYDAMDRAYELFCYHENLRDPSKSRVSRLLNNFFLKVCTGYGTQPLRVLLAALGVITIFAIIYAALGGQIFQTDSDQPDGGYGWDFYLYFSLTTFFAGGVEGVRPDFEGGVKMLVAAETILGYLLMALLVVMLTRKLTR